MSAKKASSSKKTAGDETPPADKPEAVIVSSRPILKQPEVAADDSEVTRIEVKRNPSKLLNKPREPLLTAPVLPVDEVDNQQKTDAAAVEIKAPKPEAATAAPEPPVEATKKPAVDEPKDEPESAVKEAEPQIEPLQELAKPDAEPETEDQAEQAEATSDTVTKQPTPDEAEAAEAKAQAEHDAAVQKLIDSKQYFVPVNAVEKRRSKRFVALGILLSVLLVAAWVDIALDAGLIQINGVKPVTHFFSN
jgi:flagellar biosynthesis GTPase FlhF